MTSILYVALLLLGGFTASANRPAPTANASSDCVEKRELCVKSCGKQREACDKNSPNDQSRCVAQQNQCEAGCNDAWKKCEQTKP
jgi:hypothetical protein